MLALVETLSQAAHDARGLAYTHGYWMAWNLVLAVVPVVLAFTVFRRGRPRTAGWWFGVAVFVLFLPNAPYVITDAIHLFDDIRLARSDLQILGEFVPLYVTFFAVGFGCYAVALDRVWRYVRSDMPGVSWWPIECALHGLCAIGLYLGRVVRLNSWHVFTRPQTVLGSVNWLVGPFPIFLIVCTFVALVIGTWVTRALLWSFVRFAQQARRQLQAGAA